MRATVGRREDSRLIAPAGQNPLATLGGSSPRSRATLALTGVTNCGRSNHTSDETFSPLVKPP